LTVVEFGASFKNSNALFSM